MKNKANKLHGIVTVESAMLLREIGYDKPVNYVYNRNTRKKIGWDTEFPVRVVSHNANELKYALNELSAPTILEVNEWLLNKYGMKIFTIPAEHTKRTRVGVLKYITYNKAGDNFIYVCRVHITPSFYNNEPLAEFVIDYLDTDIVNKNFKTEFDAFECGLKTICNAIIEYNKSKQ